MLKLFSQIKRFVLDLLLPIECLNCSQPGEYFCTSCQKKLKINTETESDKLSTDLICSSLEKVFIAGNYEDPLLKNLIINYKYHFLSPLSLPLGKFLVEFWKQFNALPYFNSSTLIIPIPLSKKRYRWRGFNQAELLANLLAEELNCLSCLNLKRKKHRQPQVELNEKKRLENVRQIFSWQGPNLSGKTIVLIDDVTTTGATLEAAAEALEKAGPQKIYGLVLAKG